MYAVLTQVPPSLPVPGVGNTGKLAHHAAMPFTGTVDYGLVSLWTRSGRENLCGNSYGRIRSTTDPTVGIPAQVVLVGIPTVFRKAGVLENGEKRFANGNVNFGSGTNETLRGQTQNVRCSSDIGCVTAAPSSQHTWQPETSQ